MADGLLTSGLNWIDQQKQALKARFGLLADNPEEFARQLAAEQRQRAGVGLLGEPKTAQEMTSGAWINTPYGRQAMEAGSGFAGTTIGKPINLWHGTTKTFEKFNPENSFKVDGIWLTEDKNYAQWLADKKQKLQKSGTASVLNVKSNAKNPMVFDILEEAKKLANDINVDMPQNAFEAQQLLSGSYGWDNVVKDLVNEAKSKGNDSLIIKNFNDSWHSNPNDVTTAHVIFDPKLLKIKK